MPVESILEGLNWFTRLQIEVLKPKVCRTSESDLTEVVRKIFVEKLSHEVQRSETLMYKSFTITEGCEDSESNSSKFRLHECAKMDLNTL